MKRIAITLLMILSLFTVTVAESFACDDHHGSSTSSTHDSAPKESKEKSKADYSHSCCHAHYVSVKLDKAESAVPLSFEDGFYPAALKTYSDHQSGPLLEPPAQS